MFYSGKFISYSLLEQVKDSLGFYILGALIYAILSFIKVNLEFDYIILNVFFYTVIFFLTYFGLVFLFDRELFNFIKRLRG